MHLRERAEQVRRGVLEAGGFPFEFPVATPNISGDPSVALMRRAITIKQRDERVRIIDTSARTTHGPTHDYVLTSAYVGFLLPLMIELQHLQRQERPGP